RSDDRDGEEPAQDETMVPRVPHGLLPDGPRPRRLREAGQTVPVRGAVPSLSFVSTGRAGLLKRSGLIRVQGGGPGAGLAGVSAHAPTWYTNARARSNAPACEEGPAMRAWALATLGQSLLLLGVAPPATVSASRIAALIEQLGDDSFDRREAASKALADVGVP